MRVLIIRPEREATALATALSERGHVPVIAPLFRLEFLHPTPDFAATLAACQAVLLTSANGARALAEASDQRGRPIVAVGDTTASTAEGLGFGAVTSASGDGESLVALVRRQFDPRSGPLLHVSGREVAVDLAAALGPAGFEVRRFVLYDAREETALPDAARAALEARAIDAVTFFSPRAASVFATMVDDAGLAANLHGVTAVAISPAALAPATGLPFKAVRTAAKPTRQAVLDEIDRLATAGVDVAEQGNATMSDSSSSARPAAESVDVEPVGTEPVGTEPASPPPTGREPVVVRKGLGVVGAFAVGVVAAAAVLAAALATLPYWPEPARALWRGPPAAATAAPPAAAAADPQAIRTAAQAAAKDQVEAARSALGARLDDLEKRLGALSATASTAAGQAAPAPAAGPDPALAELKAKVEALENRPAPAAEKALVQTEQQAQANKAETDKEIAVLNREIAALRDSLQSVDRAVAGQRDQTKALSDGAAKRAASAEKALASARGSAVIGIAARLEAAVEAGQPFAKDLALLGPLVQGDDKLAAIAARLQPFADKGVASRVALADAFPAVAKAALADDVSDDSFGERLLGKVRGLVSLRRVGDVPGDSTEARLARAETALHAGDVARAVSIVKSLPAATEKATAAWLARAEAYLAAKAALEELAAAAAATMGEAR